MYAFFGGGILSEKHYENKPAGKRKKAVATVIIAVLVVLAAVLGFLAYKFRSHIHAAFIWLTTSEEGIQGNIDKAKGEQIDVLVDSGLNASNEANEALQSGTITADEYTSILLGESTLDEIISGKDKDDSGHAAENVDTSLKDNASDAVSGNEEPLPDENDRTDLKNEIPSQTENNNSENKGNANAATENSPQNKPQTNTQTNTQTNSQTGNNTGTQSGNVDKRIAELVTKMYVLKSEYTGAIEGVVAGMKAEFAQLPAEQRNKSSKIAIAERHMGQINAMEAQCDAQVNSIVTELRKLLKDNGRDAALADAIVSSYETEKANTKAYYLSTYGD